MKKEIIKKVRSFEKAYGMYNGVKKLDGICIYLEGEEHPICIGYDLYNSQADKFIKNLDIEKWRHNKGLVIAEKIYLKLQKEIPNKEREI